MNETKVLLILTQDVLDRALVLAGEGDGRAQAPGEPPDCPPSPSSRWGWSRRIARSSSRTLGTRPRRFASGEAQRVENGLRGS